MSSSEFYDNYLHYQVNSGINDRIYGLYKRVIKTGIPSRSSILEIGCGIGALTYLLSGKVGNGHIEAIDLSAASIDYARQHIKNPNLNFTAADILEYSPANSPYDRVLIFDVLEHIPTEKHSRLFDSIRSWLKEEGLLLINIPNPGYILYDQQHNPTALQELDLPVHTSILTRLLDQSGLELRYFETYSVWARDDYHFLIVKKHSAFSEKLLSSERNFLQKARVWLGRKWRKTRYGFPVKLGDTNSSNS